VNSNRVNDHSLYQQMRVVQMNRSLYLNNTNNNNVLGSQVLL